ncbi:fatty acid desaturase [Amycolatopsis sp. NPDC023774]|uniref:fatty acid desaturase n=1 Tax=Amycolatopsis sp. NPDC023774 TaxID=3155015 RepID=UPI0034119D5D
MYAQLAFLGHDAGHRQIFHGRDANDRLGRALGGLIGISYGWWMGKHNRHHAQPNHEDADPDLDIFLLAFTRSQTRDRRALVRWTAKHQAALRSPLQPGPHSAWPPPLVTQGRPPARRTKLRRTGRRADRHRRLRARGAGHSPDRLLLRRVRRRTDVPV